MPVKCAMCPKKNATLDDSNAVKCSKCGLLYHPSCAKRAKINTDGWISFCCYSTAADEVNEVNDLDENSRVLFKLIEAKFNGLEVKFNGLDSKIDNTLITVKEKLCELDDRVLKLEDNNVYLLENVISEINKRNSKECNCIIYKLEDSENAVKKDIELFKNLLACCNDEPSFNINDIKLIRLGKKFKSGVDRPLKVVFPNKDCLHWFFHNKKMIIEKSKKSIIITGDLTNAQRDFRNKVLSEIKLLKEEITHTTKYGSLIENILDNMNGEFQIWRKALSDRSNYSSKETACELLEFIVILHWFTRPIWMVRNRRASVMQIGKMYITMNVAIHYQPYCQTPYRLDIMDFKKVLTQLNEKRGFAELIKDEPYILTSFEIVSYRTVASLRKHSETIKVFLPDRFELTKDFINSYIEDTDNTVTLIYLGI
ncbi:hypothetical protein FQA39_LY09168 [Lamprigera yunnana]|nr:hypothetical protein FQA39_LY09168 [Lamprigera yunnana]